MKSVMSTILVSLIGQFQRRVKFYADNVYRIGFRQVPTLSMTRHTKCTILTKSLFEKFSNYNSSRNISKKSAIFYDCVNKSDFEGPPSGVLQLSQGMKIFLCLSMLSEFNIF